MLGAALGRRIGRTGQTEVENLHDAFRCDLNVGRLQVAMHNVLFVRGFDAVDQLRDERQRFIERERTLENVTLTYSRTR